MAWKGWRENFSKFKAPILASFLVPYFFSEKGGYMIFENKAPIGCGYCPDMKCLRMPRKPEAIPMAEALEPYYQRLWRKRSDLMIQFVRDNPNCRKIIKTFAALYPEKSAVYGCIFS